MPEEEAYNRREAGGQKLGEKEKLRKRRGTEGWRADWY